MAGLLHFPLGVCIVSYVQSTPERVFGISNVGRGSFTTFLRGVLRASFARRREHLHQSPAAGLRKWTLFRFQYVLVT